MNQSAFELGGFLEAAVDDMLSALERAVPLQGLIGYLNFSEGRPDPRFEKQLSDAFAALSKHGAAEPWRALLDVLPAAVESLRTQQPKAFSDVSQAAAVIRLATKQLLPDYRRHHADLFSHLSDEELFQPYFLARVFEAVLSQRGPWEEDGRILAAAMKQLNDYVGHRPVAVLESRPRGEPYDNERFRPVPLFIKGAGVAWGKYHDILERTLDILQHTDPAILHDAGFDLNLLDELAVDPRGYDFGHPADKRPNYVFGEWDPHHIDQQGRYRRFVVRKTILDGLVEHLERSAAADKKEMLIEAAALLGGTVLMAAGVCGRGPTAHDSTVSLATLVPRIARYREAYYARLLEKLPARHAARLREDAKRTRQPFGAVRQALNHYLSQQRAYQLQQRHLAYLFADIGYPQISRRQIERVPVASVRILTDLHNNLTTGHLLIEQGEPVKAAELLPVIEELLHRGIRCGALPDPWNILGFQAHYPRFAALEDSVRDQRIDELVAVVDGIFSLYGRVLSEGTATGALANRQELIGRMRALAEWWDRFASVEVGDVERVHGGENASSAENVADALEQWRSRGEATADLAFWRQHLEDFRSPKAFARVVDALLRKKDYQASMALLMTWLQQADAVPLEHGDESFHVLALRWMLAVCGARAEADQPPINALPMVARFFDYLEANADVYWQVPRLDILGLGEEEQEGEVDAEEPPAADNDEEDVYGAAYEGVTYRDSTDDDVEAEVLDIMPEKDFDLTSEAERLEKRLQFLTTVARLWNVASRVIRRPRQQEPTVEIEKDSPFFAWSQQARENYRGLLALLDTVHEHDVPKPTGTYESLVEFDRRRLLKERLLGTAIVTCLDNAMAVGALRGALNDTEAGQQAPPWEALILRLEQALWRGDAATAQGLIPDFILRFRDEPLLYTPLSHGGHPRQILRASIAQIILRGLVANLPRLGLIRDTYQLIRAAHEMERRQPIEGPRITEFDHLFRFGCHAVAEAVVDAAEHDDAAKAVGERAKCVVDVLQAIFEPFRSLWIEHSSTLRVATLEGLNSEQDWRQLRKFIQDYGADLFDARFMTVANLRGILHRGVGAYFEYLRDNPDPLHPIRLIDDLDKRIPRGLAERLLSIILQCTIENYEEYRDYNATTTQSDYGQNLYQLLDFLRLKARYERDAWRFKPVALVHEVLARRFTQAADLWRERFAESTRDVAAAHLQQLAELEKTHSMRLATVSDYLHERFMKPMEIDRLCALVEPAMDSVRGSTPAGNVDYARLLEHAVDRFGSTPSGAGFDLPGWIRRLEQEVHRYHGSRTALVSLAETLYQIPKIPRSLHDLQQQMEDVES